LSSPIPKSDIDRVSSLRSKPSEAREQRDKMANGGKTKV